MQSQKVSSWVSSQDHFVRGHHIHCDCAEKCTKTVDCATLWVCLPALLAKLRWLVPLRIDRHLRQRHQQLCREPRWCRSGPGNMAASPVRGLSGVGVDRLGLWPKLWEQWVCRTFALTLHRCVPRLSAFTRAEKLADGTLTVVVTSSAVASELSFVRDLLLEQVNRELLEAVGRLDDKQRRMVRPVLRLHHRVGKLAGLPKSAEWQERPTPTSPPSATTESDHRNPAGGCDREPRPQDEICGCFCCDSWGPQPAPPSHGQTP